MKDAQFFFVGPGYNLVIIKIIQPEFCNRCNLEKKIV